MLTCSQWNKDDTINKSKKLRVIYRCTDIRSFLSFMAAKKLNFIHKNNKTNYVIVNCLEGSSH